MSSSWMGIVRDSPDDWHRQKFGEVFRQRVERGRQGLPLLSVTGENGVVLRDSLDRRDSSNADKSRYLAVMPGDVVYNTMRMWQGVSGISPHQGITSPAYTVCMMNRDIHSGFAGYLLKLPSLVAEFHSRSQGIVNDTLSLKYPKFAEIPVALPPLHEQRRIAEILSSVDEAIAATRAVIEQTRKVKQAALERLLTKGIGHTRFKQTEIGEIPEGWETGKVGEFFTLQRGFDITEKHASAGEYPVVSSSGISYYHSTAMISGPAVITGRKGKLGQVHFIEGSCWPHDTTLWVRDFKGSEPKFIYWFLRALNLAEFDAATAVPTLNRNVVHALKCAFPPNAEQLLIADRLDIIEQTERSQTRNLVSYEHMKSALMADLLTGRKRVTDALPLAAE